MRYQATIVTPDVVFVHRGRLVDCRWTDAQRSVTINIAEGVQRDRSRSSRAPLSVRRLINVFPATPPSSSSSTTTVIGVPASAQYLTLGGRVLEDGVLAEQGVSSLMTVNVGVRMKGGKVHGSLARAGKVKGQTPKVEAEEKKKKKTGRAKRRIQYNKRFVNVVVGFGKKRGPNSNSE